MILRLRKFTALGIILSLFAVVDRSSAFAEGSLTQRKLGVAIPYGLATLDPLEQRDPVGFIICQQLRAPLLLTENAGLPVLHAASALEVSADGLIWKLVLNPEARFLDGSQLSAKTVARSFRTLKQRAALPHNDFRGRLAFSQQAAGQPFKDGFSVIEKIRAESDGSTESVVFTLRQNYPAFASFLSHWPILQQSVAKVFGRDLFEGTNYAAIAPFIVRSNRPDQGVVLEGVQNFFEGGIPRAQILDFAVYSDAASALSALRVGAVDIIALPTPEIIAGVEKDETLKVISSPLSEIGIKHWNLRRANWSRTEDSADALMTDAVVVRRTVRFDERFYQRFDLSGSYLP